MVTEQAQADVEFNARMQRIVARINESILLTREPRYRYFQIKNGPMFCWTVEKVDGSYECFTYEPVGKGSRSGKATEWRLDEGSFSRTKLRRDAKETALRRFRKWKASA